MSCQTQWMPRPGLQAAAALLVIDRVYDAALVIDARREVTGRWESTARRIGASDESILGTRIFERLHPDDLATTLGVLDRMTALGSLSTNVTVRIRHPVTPTVWMSVRLEIVDGRANEDVAGFVVVARLVEPDDPAPPVVGLVDAMPFGVAVLDAVDTVVFVNAAFTDFTGLAAGPVRTIPSGTATVIAEIARVGAMTRTGHVAEAVVTVGTRTLQLGARTLGGAGDVVVTVIDITRRMALIEAQARSERVFAAVFDHSPTGVAIVSLEGEFLRVNDAWSTVCGHAASDLIGTTFAAITHPDDIEADLEYVEELLAGTRESYRIEKRYLTALGHTVWVDLRAAVVLDGDMRPVHFISQIVDITERKHAEGQAIERELALRHQATHDHLTGLPNRVLFDAHLEQLLRRADRTAPCHALLMCDLDRFKAVNDAHGHQAGDRVLRTIAERILQTCRAADIVVRLGGDEFAILAVDVRYPQDSRLLAVRIIGACTRPVDLGAGLRVTVGVSIGIAVLERGESAADALDRADAAAYQAKRLQTGYELAGPPRPSDPPTT